MKLTKLPTHLAIILDGNGRWAQKRGKDRNFGHYMGVQNLKEIVKVVRDLKIQYLSLYCFSFENMKRPKEEVSYLMDLAKVEFEHLKEKNPTDSINVRIIGEDDNLSNDILDIKQEINSRPFIKDAFTLFIAFNYSSTLEIKHASKISNGDDFEQHLYTYPAPAIDLLIRTSGEERLSNFMLYQMSYAELYFTKTYWPSFKTKDLRKALTTYQKRRRNFGLIEPTINKSS